MSHLIVGLTGGLASGKSTLAGWLEEAGCTVVDADRLVADSYGADGPGTRAVGKLFGPGMLAADGSVDRARLAARVFSDNTARKRLEQAIHPLVRSHFRDIAAGHDGIVVLEATLLLESEMAPDFDIIITVEADSEKRVARATSRGLTDGEARDRIAAQGSDLMRREGADIVIDNNGDLSDLRDQTDDLIRRLRDLAGNR